MQQVALPHEAIRQVDQERPVQGCCFAISDSLSKSRLGLSRLRIACHYYQGGLRHVRLLSRHSAAWFAAYNRRLSRFRPPFLPLSISPHCVCGSESAVRRCGIPGVPSSPASPLASQRSSLASATRAACYIEGRGTNQYRVPLPGKRGE